MEGAFAVVIRQGVPAAGPEIFQDRSGHIPPRQRLRQLAAGQQLRHDLGQGVRVQTGGFRQLGGGGQGGAAAVCRLHEPLSGGTLLPDGQGIQNHRIVPLMAGRTGVQHGAAADGLHRGVEPDDEPVAGFGGDGLRQP